MLRLFVVVAALFILTPSLAHAQPDDRVIEFCLNQSNAAGDMVLKRARGIPLSDQINEIHSSGRSREAKAMLLELATWIYQQPRQPNNAAWSGLAQRLKDSTLTFCLNRHLDR